MAKRFEGLKRSEIKKAERLANRVNHCNDCRVSGYSAQIDPEFENMYTIQCEICHNYEDRANHDVYLQIPMWDRRRTWAYAIVEGEYIR